MKVLLIDHQDSFVYNLYQQLRGLGAEVHVVRHDARPSLVHLVDADALVLSPGPGHPRNRGMTRLARGLLHSEFRDRPVLGVCLGHQLIAELLGGRVARAGRPVHGATALILHSNRGLFEGVPSPFPAARYHSLVVQRPGSRERFRVTARTESGVVMAIDAKERPWHGVQFHPESFLTDCGDTIVHNFLLEARR